MELIRCQNAQEAQIRAGEALSAFLMKAKKQAKPVLLLLSGGSAFSLLDSANKDTLGSHITIGVLDERFSRDETKNNFAQFTETLFYKLCCSAGVLFIDTRVKGDESQDALTVRFEKALRDWAEAHADGILIVTMGVGVDGHTAGILSFPENPALFRKMFENEKMWVVAYDAGNKNPHPLRVTVTLPFLRREVDYAVVYVAGEEKKDALKCLLMTQGSLADTPARILHEMRNVHLYTPIKV